MPLFPIPDIRPHHLTFVILGQWSLSEIPVYLLFHDPKYKLKNVIDIQMSLIFSTNVLHWIKEKDAIAKNISDLSAKKAHIFLYFMAMPETDWPWLNSALRIAAGRKFYEWERRFLSNGLEVCDKKMFEHVEFFDETVYETSEKHLP